MQLAQTLTRSATAPLKLGLAVGELGVSVVRSVVGEARRAWGSDTSRADGWRRPQPPPVWSPGPEVRERGDSAPPAPGPVEAGAEVHIDPPWDGYDAMTAIQVQQRLASAAGEEVAGLGNRCPLPN